MKELWQEIDGYEGYYEVSNFGRVRSVDRYITKSNGVTQLRKGKIKTQTDNTDGYSTVNLSKDGKDTRVGVHILVANAFVDGKMDGYEVNHIDFDRHNNHFSNLEWLSHHDNVLKSIDAGRHVCCTNLFGENNPNYGNHILSEKYMDKDLAIEKQSRPGAKNGRSLPIELICDNFSKHFSYIRECAAYMINNNLCSAHNLDNVSARISYAAKNNKKYNGYSFRLV